MNILFRAIKLALFVLGIVAFVPHVQAEYTDDCITFSSAASFTLRTGNGKKNWDGMLWTSTDKTNWTVWDGMKVSAAKTGGMYTIHVRGDAGNTKIAVGYYWMFTGSAGIACTGNIETLRGATGDNPSPTPMAEKCYCGMFRDCTALTSAPALTATTLAANCYDYMFAECKSLTAAPELPATTLAEKCYTYMFYNCTALTSAPALLPATTLAANCYSYMFSCCSSLTNAPALPATTLAASCYSHMFQCCSSLTNAPALPATTLAVGCYSGMFSACTSLTVAPELAATTLAKASYSSMFFNCKALTNAPALPATTLADSCYKSMFYGCEAIEANTTAPGKEWKIPATITPASNWGTDMFKGSGGTLQGQPALNTTYYIKSALPPTQNDDCIAFSSTASFSLKTYSSEKSWDGTLWASTDKTNWTVWDGTKRSSARTDGLYNLYVRGNACNTTIVFYDGYWCFTGSAGIACTGNIETLRGATGDDPSPTPMADYCYWEMFGNCTLLTSAPALPATTLAEGCYKNMFCNCSSLTNAPALPATTLTRNCYANMFYGCTSLTTAPALLATTLADNCYECMFGICRSLEVNTMAPGKKWKIPAISTTTTGWGYNMFWATKGTLQGQPELNTTYYIASAPSEPIEPGGEIVVSEGTAEAKATEINGDPTVKAQYLKAPGGVETTSDYLGCFSAVATSGSTVEFVLNEEGTNEVLKATSTIKTTTLDVVLSVGSTVTIDEPLVGFYYSLKQGANVSVSDQSDLNKLGGRDSISFELTKDPLQYFYQTIVSPTPVLAE